MANIPGTEVHIEALFGKNAMQVPFNCIVQGGKEKGVAVVAAVVVIRGPEAERLLMGSNKTHQLIIGDAVIRPKLAMESDHLTGTGLSGLAMHGMADIDGWLKHGNVLIEHGIRCESPSKVEVQEHEPESADAAANKP